MWITINCGKFLKRWEYQTTFPVSWETCMRVKKQQLEPAMEQQTGSKLEKEYIKDVYCHPAYLTYMEKAMAPHSSTLLPGKSHGRGSVAGFSPWGCWESDTTEQLHFHFSLSSFTFIKRLFSSSLLSAIRVVAFAYLRLLIFLLAILIPACNSSSRHFAWGTLRIN